MCKILESFALNSLELASYILRFNIVSFILASINSSSHDHSTEGCSPVVVKIYNVCGS